MDLLELVEVLIEVCKFNKTKNIHLNGMEKTQLFEQHLEKVLSQKLSTGQSEFEEQSYSVPL